MNVVVVRRGCPASCSCAENLGDEWVEQHKVVDMTMRAVGDLAGGVLVVDSLKNWFRHYHVAYAA